MSQLEKRIKQIERENDELVKENSELIDIVRRLSAIIDEQYILIAQYLSIESAEGLAPLFHAMHDVSQTISASAENAEA